MTDYYSAVVLFSCLALLCLLVMVRENARFPRTLKKRLYSIYTVILISILSEYFSVMLNGAPAWSRMLHAVVKAADYIFTPLAAVMFMRQITDRHPLYRWLLGLLSFNAVFELVSVFTGWSFFINDFNYYQHGPLHFVYIITYALSILSFIIVYISYCRRFENRNWVSLACVGSLICLGILIQELSVPTLRTCALGLAVGSVLQFIHYTEFRQQENDIVLEQKDQLLETDPLTGMLNRFACTKALAAMAASIPEDLIIVSMDVNNLKLVNDTLGHLAGDELICGAADCIHQVLEPYGHCYRVGGDEFIALLRTDSDTAERLCTALKERSSVWRGKLAAELSMACGCAVFREDPTMEMGDLFRLADHRMYDAKARHYQALGQDCR